ncbi:uncharacterized protein LOC112554443 isoform X2 [Pomacea canaliculata]|uniref:uncharacterized protein LOC112554443 isoform X2 n=1 Tax=Pomacea canaliculata TaxID=400727 RepID=UPI000D73655A|nr:uncharacterized protein LOC112554443 isoform X2 [Pomacea canaliculata]
MYNFSGDHDPLLIRVPEPAREPLPMRMAKKYGFGYRRPVPQVTPHWSQWPQTRPYTTVGLRKSSNQETGAAAFSVPGIHHWNSSAQAPPLSDSSMQKGDRTIMSRGLSPRRAPPPVMPGRSLSRTGNFNNSSSRFVTGSLDLHASPYNANRGFWQGFTAYSTRESRPMYRHANGLSRRGDDYVHDQSIFFSTSPLVSGHFIIHPDWVSERSGLRRSKSLLSF